MKQVIFEKIMAPYRPGDVATLTDGEADRAVLGLFAKFADPQETVGQPTDFYASERHFAEHASAIWKYMRHKGNFYVDESIAGFFPFAVPLQPGAKLRVEMMKYPLRPIAVFAWGDLKRVSGYRMNVIFGEHGIGHTYNEGHGSYAGNASGKDRVRLLLCQNQAVVNAYKGKLPRAERAIIGVPAMDEYPKKEIERENPVIAAAFHWDCLILTETRSAAAEYIDEIKALAKKYTILGHGHPRAIADLQPKYEAAGIEVVFRFEEVLRRADLLICDNSSVLYMFAFTGRPVVILNSKHYRKDITHRGNPRFWQHAGIGPQVDRPEDLEAAIKEALAIPDKYEEARKKMIDEVFTFRDGRCGERAADAIAKNTAKL